MEEPVKRISLNSNHNSLVETDHLSEDSSIEVDNIHWQSSKIN